MIELILAAAAAATPVEAERQFAADAQKLGQWSAFRKWSADDALMFTPQPINAHAFLKERKDPPVAVFWWPGRSYVSCDGNFAVNTGPWVREWGKSVGYFTTVWKRQPDGTWKWIYDAGDSLKVPRAEGGDVQARKATCPGAVSVPPPPQPKMPANVKYGKGSSKDRTLSWFWAVEPSGKRSFTASLWDGRKHRIVVRDEVAAASQ